MAYNKTTWVDDSEPFLSAENLNKIEQGIADAATDSTASADIDGTNTLVITDTAGVVTYDVGVLNFVEARIIV